MYIIIKYAYNPERVHLKCYLLIMSTTNASDYNFNSQRAFSFMY